MSEAKKVVEDLFGRGMWSNAAASVFPFDLNSLDLEGVLPGIFYCFRWGARRGRGTFAETFGAKATALDVARRLAARPELEGLAGPVPEALLADLLLRTCLDAKKRSGDRRDPLIRAFPVHYASSWVDLPNRFNHLRGVPEAVTALLAGQEGAQVQPGGAPPFPVASRLEENLLLRAFGRGLRWAPVPDDLAGDRYREEAWVGLDELLALRLAQCLGRAPEKARGGGAAISNLRPPARRQTDVFAEDLDRFLRTYADALPRGPLVDLLEASLALGLTGIFTASLVVFDEWARSGAVRADAAPPPLLADASLGADRALCRAAEASFARLEPLLDALPLHLARVRLLEWAWSRDRHLRAIGRDDSAYGDTWLAALGRLAEGDHERSEAILDRFYEKACDLVERLADLRDDVAADLEAAARDDPLGALAAALADLMGGRNTKRKVDDFFNGVLQADRPTGLARRRWVRRSGREGATRSRVVRSLVLTDPVLELLVHLDLAARERVSFARFLERLEERYGIFVGRAPAGLDVDNDLLDRNRAILERRLRELGLLVGVNDAEAMKRLRPRFGGGG